MYLCVLVLCTQLGAFYKGKDVMIWQSLEKKLTSVFFKFIFTRKIIISDINGTCLEKMLVNPLLITTNKIHTITYIKIHQYLDDQACNNYTHTDTLIRKIQVIIHSL